MTNPCILDMKKIGMRTIKTGIAVFLATLAGYFGIVQTPVYTVSVCIFSIKNTMKNSVSDSRSRILGTLLGGIIGYLFALITDGDIISTTIGVVFIIHLCHSLKISNSAGIASVTFTAIVIGVGQNHPLSYSILRTIDTMVGVLIALLVNYGISRKKYLKYLCTAFNTSHDECIAIVSDMVSKDNYSSYPSFQSKFEDLENYYNQLLDEITYSKRNSDLNHIHNYFDICDLLLHHIHGLYLLENKTLDNDVYRQETICKYHKNTISKLLDKAFKTEVSLDLVLQKK